MDFSLSEEQRMMVESARRLAKKHIEPVLAENDRDQGLPKAAILKIMAKATELGLTSARIPAESGGAGLKMLDYGLIVEQIPVQAALFLQPHDATTTRIFYGCNDEQKERFLGDCMAGRMIASTAITEPNVGSDARSVETRVTEDGDELVLNGRKQWISNAIECDLMIVSCRATSADGSTRVMRVIVERAKSPFEVHGLDIMGLRQAPLGEVLFDNCRVPKRNLCPDDGDTARIQTLPWLANRATLGLLAANLAQKALDAACSYAGTRKQFGRPIGGFQAIQKDLADIETAVVTSRLLCYHALAAIDRGERVNGLSAMAKRYAIDASEHAIALAMRVHGAMGLSRELGLEQMARDVRCLVIPDGTPGILALIQGRELTGIAAFRS